MTPPKKQTKTTRTKKHECKPDPKVVAVVEAAREVVDSNARESRVVALAEALNTLDTDKHYNPFGVVPVKEQ